MTRRFRRRLPRLRHGFKREIVKLQRTDIAHNKAQVMIHNEDKSVVTTYPLTDSLREAFADEFVQYWLADVPEERGELLLIKKMKEQTW